MYIVFFTMYCVRLYIVPEKSSNNCQDSQTIENYAQDVHLNEVFKFLISYCNDNQFCKLHAHLTGFITDSFSTYKNVEFFEKMCL